MDSVVQICVYIFFQMQTYGFDTPDFVSPEVYEEFHKSYEVVLQRRCDRWKSVIDQSHLTRGYQRRSPSSSLTPPVKRFCRKGIPAEFRSHVWMTLSGAYETMRENPKVYSAAAAAEPTKKIYTAIMAG